MRLHEIIIKEGLQEWLDTLKNGPMKIRGFNAIKQVNVTRFRAHHDNKWLIDVGMMLYIPKEPKGGGKEEFWDEHSQILNAVKDGKFLKALEKKTGLTLLSQPHYVNQREDRYELLFGIGRSSENPSGTRGRSQDITHGDSAELLGKQSYYYINLAFHLVKPTKQR